MPKIVEEIVGLKFGKLMVVEKLKERKSSRIIYKCNCDCGNEHIIDGYSLRTGRCKSCGCNRFSYQPSNKIENRDNALWRYLYNSTIIKRNKKFNIKTEITLEEFISISKGPCFYCGLYDSNFIKDRKKINKIDRTSNCMLKYNGIDRIDNDLGYIKHNIVTCCKYCNTAKNTMSQEDFFIFIKRIYTHLFCVKV
jgi:hypothetical protein